MGGLAVPKVANVSALDLRMAPVTSVVGTRTASSMAISAAWVYARFWSIDSLAVASLPVTS
jgi:hypothetical protein